MSEKIEGDYLWKRESLRSRVWELMTDYHPIDVLETIHMFATMAESSRLKIGSNDRSLNQFMETLDQTITAASDLEWIGTEGHKCMVGYQKKTQYQEKSSEP